MIVRTVVRRQVRRRPRGAQVAADVGGVVVASLRERAAQPALSSRRRVRVVQRHGRTEVSESTDE